MLTSQVTLLGSIIPFGWHELDLLLYRSQEASPPPLAQPMTYTSSIFLAPGIRFQEGSFVPLLKDRSAARS